MRSPYIRMTIAPLLLPLTVLADAAPAAGDQPNFLLILLLCLAVILIFVIGMLAQVLKQLSFAYLDKWKRERSNSTTTKTVALLLLFLLPAFGALADSAETPAPASPFIDGMPRTEFYFLAGFVIFEVFVALVLLWQIMRLLRLLRSVPEKAHIPRAVFRRNFLDIFNQSVAVEKEASIVLDHNYDGIHELDNDLPPWWKWGFVMTIIFSVVYLSYYQLGGGPNQVAEYHAAVAKAEEEKAAYLALAANNVDENNVTLVTDPAALGDAQNIFQNTCSACHAKDGGGNVGPNLTDDYWLHGGSIRNIFRSIKYGWPDKGMKSWKDDYSPRQLAALASYIKSLKGSHPAVPKAPQGTLYQEEATAAAGSSQAQPAQ